MRQGGETVGSREEVQESVPTSGFYKQQKGCREAAAVAEVGRGIDR
jgi:hypothetical protein